MSVADGKLMHCLSFDVEEHFQVSAFWSEARRQQWDKCESRVEDNTRKLVELLAQHDTKATFFVLGWVAERYPDLVKMLAGQGHEIASHGYGHELITGQTPGMFRDDVRRAKGILEDICGKQVYGYRAPSFSITKDTKWAIPVLTEEGYLYDSSIFPVLHDRYGMPDATPTIHLLHGEAGCIWEVPPSTANIFGTRLPVAGGGYFRLFPYPILRQLLKRIERAGHPLVMYLHPWELDPDQPKMQGSCLSMFRHYINLHKTEDRLRSLLKDFCFTSIREALEPVSQACARAEIEWSQGRPLALDDHIESSPRDLKISTVR
jgi:polysaccharide deacetylase family protein (PEP-CTERM system associated)